MLVRQNTKTARTWASDYVPDDPDDQENGSPNLDRPSAMASGMEGGSAWAAHLAAEELILRGARTKPVKGQTMVDYVATITHLHLANMGLEGDLAPLRFCANVRVVYVYDNRLTSLGGLDGKLQMLTHLYAQNNLVESLDDFVAPPSLQRSTSTATPRRSSPACRRRSASPSSASPRRRSSRSRPTTTTRTRRGGRRCRARCSSSR